MPIYVFKDDDNNLTELAMTISQYESDVFRAEGERGNFIMHDGKRLKQVYVPVGTPAASVWPLESAAAGVPPEQVKEQTEYDRQAGLNTEYNPRTGDAIFRDNNHRKAHLRHHRLVDRDAFL